MYKKLRQLLVILVTIVRLITANRLARFWYYLRSHQLSIIFDRVMRLLEISKSAAVPLRLYSNGDYPDPIIFSSCTAPVVSIVIPVFNEWDTTRACLISIRENTSGLPYEIIVADDCSEDETIHLPELAPGVRYVRNTQNLGFLKNCNHAAKIAHGKYLLFLNNDTQVQPNWLQPLVACVEQDELVGLVGPMLLYPDGRVQEAGGIIWQDGSGWNYGRFDYPESPEFNYRKEVDYISGACILVRKILWDRIGGFDERFAPAYYEDTDLAFEIRRQGYRVVYQPLSRVIHLEGVSHGTNPNSGIKSRQTANRVRFRDKWAPLLDDQQGHDPRNMLRARDRSLKKKKILFIDHYVPLRDQDAGSKSTFQYLSLMAEMGYQITFLGDNFVNHQPYAQELQQMGIEVLYGARLKNRWKQWLRDYAQDFDYCFLSRPHIAQKYLPVLRRSTTAKLLYCGHDLHCLREERHYRVEGKRIYLRVAKKWATSEESILRQVDVGYFFSPVEIVEAQRRFPGVNVRTIPLYLFNMDKEYRVTLQDDQSKAGLMFVGGFMHQPNVDAVCWFVKDILPKIVAQLPEITLFIVGSNPTAEIKNLSSNHVIVTGRVSEESLLQRYQSVRVVVAPLRYGAGIKGKIIESLSHGVPTVTTTIGAEGIGDAEKALLIADGEAEFAAAVVTAYTDKHTRQQLSAGSSEIIRKHFSTNAARNILASDMPIQ